MLPLESRARDCLKRLVASHDPHPAARVVQSKGVFTSRPRRLAASARAATYYVTNATVSVSDGSADAPFGSLLDCITQLGSDGVPGSCLFLEGEYAFSETVEVRGLRGEDDDRYIIGAAPDAAVTLIGTVDVPATARLPPTFAFSFTPRPPVTITAPVVLLLESVVAVDATLKFDSESERSPQY